MCSLTMGNRGKLQEELNIRICKNRIFASSDYGLHNQLKLRVQVFKNLFKKMLENERLLLSTNFYGNN